MKPKFTRNLFLFLVLLLPFTAHAQAVAPAMAQAARVETVQFESKLVGKRLPYNVLLPSDYATAEARTIRYPVLYLLHGLGGHYTDWVERTRLKEYATLYRFLIVTPEGNNGWYSDSAGVPGNKYESYILQELIPDVQRRYRAIETRDGRAVAGLSMGGYGALKFGFKHPEMFAFAASLSGAVTAATWRTPDDLIAIPFIRQSLSETFGATPDSPVKQANDLFKFVRELPAERVAALPYFYLDCGTEDDLKLFAPNRAFADLLVEHKIPHEYRQRPGGHRWDYWDAQVQEVLRLAARRLSVAQAGAAK